MADYTGIYTDFGRIALRVPQVNTSNKETILQYMQQLDTKINNTLRSVLDKRDANSFFINLPLSGTFDIIDVIKMQVQLAQDPEVQMAADNLVIAQFRSDTAEDTEKVETAKKNLLDTIYTKYGGAISIDQDFTTEYLGTFKALTSKHVPMSLSDGSGVLLMNQSPPANQIGINPNNPDSRVIFVPGPPI